MNKERRKRIVSIKDSLCVAQADLQDVRDEEQEAYDNLPETFQYGERGDSMQGAIDALDDIIDDLGDVIDKFDDIEQ